MQRIARSWFGAALILVGLSGCADFVAPTERDPSARSTPTFDVTICSPCPPGVICATVCEPTPVIVVPPPRRR
jgi:hypothetical protein